MSFGKEFVQNAGFVMIPPQDLNDAAVSSGYIHMADYGHATVIISVGDTIGATFTVTFVQATSQAAAGEQALAYTKAWSSGQVLKADTFSGTFTIGETLTQTGGNANTGEIYEIGSDYIIVRNLTNGTTWADNAVITGGSSSATAAMNGTGEQEDILVPYYTAPSSTVTIPATTFKNYLFEIDGEMMDADDNYDWFQVVLSDPGAATLASGLIILTQPRQRGIPMPGVLGTQKMAATL